MSRIPDTHLDLVDGKVVGLATVDARGYPQLTAVRVKVDADGICHLSINTTRRKYANLVAVPRATVFAIDPANPFRTVEIRADVELVADPGKSWSQDFLGPNYDLDRMDPPGAERLHVVLTPATVNVVG